jgi:hypothetical protein
MHKNDQRCTGLLEKTAASLSGSFVSIMFLAVQRDNMELNIKQAVQWYVLMYSVTKMIRAYFHYRTHSAFQRGNGDTKKVIQICMLAFPTIWVSCNGHVLESGLPSAEMRLLFSFMSVCSHLFVLYCPEFSFYNPITHLVPWMS